MARYCRAERETFIVNPISISAPEAALSKAHQTFSANKSESDMISSSVQLQYYIFGLPCGHAYFAMSANNFLAGPPNGKAGR